MRGFQESRARSRLARVGLFSHRAIDLSCGSIAAFVPISRDLPLASSAAARGCETFRVLPGMAPVVVWCLGVEGEYLLPDAEGDCSREAGVGDRSTCVEVGGSSGGLLYAGAKAPEFPCAVALAESSNVRAVVCPPSL